MATKLLMDVEEYLHTSFEDGDRDYLDGEVEERNVGEWSHARVQFALGLLLARLGGRWGILIAPEIRVRISPGRYRVIDIGVWKAGYSPEPVPSVPAFLAIEILSPEDRMVRVQPKIAEYLSIGVEFVWLIDPVEERALVYSQSSPAGEPADVLWTANPEIRITLSELFDQIRA
jgi:Uma2 family endonuclease